MALSTVNKIKAGIILFYIVLFAGLALYDEKPDPEMAKEMAQPLPEVVEPGNAWIAFLGFTSPRGVSPYVYGEERMRRAKSALLAAKPIAEVMESFGDDKNALLFKGELPPFYNKKDNGLLAYAARHQEDIAVFSRNNEELIGRYESFRTYPRYAEPLDYGFYTPFPSFSPLRNVQKLKLLRLAVKADRGDVRGALTALREDMDFWRSIAGRTSTLISKLIAFAQLNTDLRYAADIGASRSLNNSELGLLRDVLRPFDNGEISLSRTLRGEARYMQNSMKLSLRQKKWEIGDLLVKQHATNNRNYADFREYIQLAELPSQEFAAVVKKREKENNGMRRIGVPFLYNPGGEFLSVIGQGANFHKYMEKGHNVEGLRRLAWLKVLISRERVPQERIQQFLDAHASDLGSPYTGGPMKWDSQKGSISFDGVSGEKAVELFL